MVVEDCTVVYSRSKGHQWCGGKVFALRAGGGGSVGGGGHVSNPQFMGRPPASEILELVKEQKEEE